MKKNIFAFFLLIFLFDQIVSIGQTKDSSNVESIFSESSSMRYVTVPGIQFINIQNQVSGMIGLSHGVYLNQSFFVGISGYVNLTHDKINTGVLGVEVTQTFKPEKLVHYGYSIYAGVGTVKDYKAKTNLFDNFLNIFGTPYFFAQPSILVEINFTPEMRLALGAGYRFAGGLNESNNEIYNTKLKNKELNNMNMFINLKIVAD